MVEEKESKKDTVEPGVYFNKLKNKKQKITDTVLNGIYGNCLTLMEGYQRTGQVDAMKKLLFQLETIEKEHKVLAAGVDTFVYKADVEAYIEDVEGKYVKIIELSRYEREVPTDIIARYETVKDLFDKFFVVFTDYTKEQVEVKKTKKERDPILFGMFQDKKTESTAQRLYFIGDWEDEYCDLTLDRLVSEMRPDLQERQEPVLFGLHDPVNLEEFRAKIKALEEEKNKGRISSFVSSSDIYVNNGWGTNNSTSLTPTIAYLSTVPTPPVPASVPQEEARTEEEPVKKETFLNKLQAIFRHKKD